MLFRLVPFKKNRFLQSFTPQSCAFACLAICGFASQCGHFLNSSQFAFSNIFGSQTIFFHCIHLSWNSWAQEENSLIFSKKKPTPGHPTTGTDLDTVAFAKGCSVGPDVCRGLTYFYVGFENIFALIFKLRPRVDFLHRDYSPVFPLPNRTLQFFLAPIFPAQISSHKHLRIYSMCGVVRLRSNFFPSRF